MAIKLYMDEHIPRAITQGLRQRVLDIITAQEDNYSGKSDNELIKRATELKRILFTFDSDFLKIANELIAKKIDFEGIIFTNPLKISIGQCVNDIELISNLAHKEELHNRIEYIPL